jgi:peptidoglycan hydrolase-like protein with peptidoglycan-binding domain
MGDQSCFAVLRAGGLTEAGTFAMMGNWDCESNLEPGRLQGDFDKNRAKSKDYVARATSGAMSRDEFMKAIGFGYAQWTLPYRKGKLWDYWKASGEALDSGRMQARFALRELQTEGEYTGLFQMLKTSNNLYACTEAICKQYERPAINNVGDRYAAAQRIQKELAGSAIEDLPPTTEPEPSHGTPNIMPTHEFWPPRVICEGMKGPDVEVLCALLKAREYQVYYITPEFGSFLTEKVKKYQTENGLVDDGIVGPLTWGKLLERR